MIEAGEIQVAHRVVGQGGLRGLPGLGDDTLLIEGYLLAQALQPDVAVLDGGGQGVPAGAIGFLGRGLAIQLLPDFGIKLGAVPDGQIKLDVTAEKVRLLGPLGVVRDSRKP